MEQKTQDLSQEENEQISEYRDFVKESAMDGSYFKDALDWYLLRYVSPLCDRTIMLFVSTIGALSLFLLIQIIDGLFPLVEKVPIVIRSKDQSLYTPFIKPLKNKQDKALSVDDAIAKYLLSVYVKDRESYDFRKSEVEDINRKFNRIRNNSSFGEYKNFQLFMSKDNVDSPLNQFGRDVFRTVEIQNISFIKEKPQDYYLSLKEFFAPKIANEAEIRFVATIHGIDEGNNKKNEKTNYIAKIKFSFSGVDRKAKNGIMNFSVSSYKLYKIKQ